MLVSFKFECFKHGEFTHYFDTVNYPTRNFPLDQINCPEENCGRLSQYIPFNRSAVRDDIGTGKVIESLGVYATSKNWLKRYLKTEGITQLASDEVSHKIKQKSKKQRIEEYQNKPEIIRERREIINETLKQCGVD